MKRPVRAPREGASPWLRVLGLLLIFGALGLGLLRAPDRPAESLVARWAPPPSEFIAVHGQVVHLRDEGPREDPEPIVLLHGTSSSLHTWEGWVKGLADRRRVITLDLPGFGLTGPFTDEAAARYGRDDYRGDTLARFVWDVLDTLKVERAIVGGNSLGGEVAWRMATLAPARTSRLILVDASGTLFVPESIPLGFQLARVPVLNRAGEYFLPRSVVRQGLENTWGDPTRITDDVVDRYYELALREGNRRALGLRVAQLERGAHADRLDTLKLPTLILWGRRDRLIPPAVAEEFERRIAGSQRVVLDGLGHLPQEEDPATSLAVVQRFLGSPSPP